MHLSLIFDKKYPHVQRKYKDVVCTISGDMSHVEEMVGYVSKEKTLDKKLFDLFLKNKTSFSLIIESSDYVLAVVDRISSYPIYYSEGCDKKLISNSAHLILSQLEHKDLDSESALILGMSGYVFGRETLYQHIKCMQAGEVLLWKRNSKSPQIMRYYAYLPEPKEGRSQLDLQNEFSDVVDSVILELIKKANGRPIWVPLSGGLDSRLIACKLVEHHYKDIVTFSYGNNGNHEMKQAAYVASKLGVPWHKISANTKLAYALYRSDLRREYELYSSGLNNIPSYMEFEALAQLKDKRLIADNAIIVNGQTGDYITGAHVPSSFLNNDEKLDVVFNYIIEKHCSLWRNLKSKHAINTVINKLLPQFQDISRLNNNSHNLASLYECWEWQERQSKFVVKGQRLYEYFGFQWALPFWHADILEFWKQVPYQFKINQNLYISYLRNYNFRNLFELLRRVPNKWTLRYFWIPYVAKMIGLSLGNARKEHFYKKMHFYSTYHYQYALHGYGVYKEKYRDCRDPNSFFVLDFLKNMNLDLTS